MIFALLVSDMGKFYQFELCLHVTYSQSFCNGLWGSQIWRIGMISLGFPFFTWFIANFAFPCSYSRVYVASKYNLH